MNDIFVSELKFKPNEIKQTTHFVRRIVIFVRYRKDAFSQTKSHWMSTIKGLK
jgi:hypothetical protein